MKVGSWVQLRQRVREGPQKAQIEIEADDFCEGAVRLSKRLDGFEWWNKSDLRAAKQPAHIVRQRARQKKHDDQIRNP
jgi:hypothetical protein